MNFLLYCVFAVLCVWSTFSAVEEWYSPLDDYWILASIYGITAIICFIAAGNVGA